MILFHAKRDGTVTTTPDLVPQGSSMQDLVVVSEFDYAYCAIKLLPASGEYIEDIPCTPIPQRDFSTIFTAALPPKATVVAGSVDYQLIFTAADGTTQTTLVGSFTVPRGVPVSTPGSVEELSVKTIKDLYTIIDNTYGLFVGHESNIYKNTKDIAKNTKDIAALKKTIASAGYVTIPTAQWEDGKPTIAEFTLDGFGAGMTAMLIPADSNTQTAAREAKMSAYPVAFPIDSDTQTVEIIRADADKAPDIPLRFAYLILKTEATTAPSVAIIGVDAYGEGGGGVDETAVKAIITEMLGNVANERQYSAANPPPYPVTSVNGQTGAVKLTIPSEAADVKADPAGTAERKTADLRNEVNGKLADYDKSTTVNNKISEHNVSTASHEDLRLELQRLAERLNAALNSDDTSLDDLKEIVAYIKSNKTLIDGITSSKVNVTDIVNNLTTNTANVPLSAAQGVALKLLIDSLEEIVEGKVTAEQVATQISTALSDYPTTADMGTAISNATKDLAPKSLIPTKVSRLSNDSGYLTPTTGDQRYAKTSDIPTVPQTLPNPYALTILGKTYTGGKAVSLTAEEIMEAIKTASGGVVSYLDGNRIVLSGNLPDATYTAYYEVNGELVEIGDLTIGSVTPDPVTYTIRWVNHDGEVLKTVTVAKGDSEPEYDGPTPTRAEDGQYTYTFKGWDKTVDDATGDVTYTATYTQTAKPAEPTYDNLFKPAQALLNTRVSNSHVAVQDEKAVGMVTTHFMTVPAEKLPFTSETKIYIKGATFTKDSTTKIIVFTNSSGSDYSARYGNIAGSALTPVDEGNGVISVSGIQGSFSTAVKRVVMTLKVKDTAITESDVAGIVITIGEPIN